MAKFLCRSPLTVRSYVSLEGLNIFPKWLNVVGYLEVDAGRDCDPEGPLDDVALHVSLPRVRQNELHRLRHVAQREAALLWRNVAV